MWSYLFNWTITIIVEFILLWLILRKNPSKLLIYSILINSITLPIASALFLYISSVILIEVLVVVMETVLIKYLLQLDYKKSFILALLLNLVTSLISFIL